MGIIFSSFLDNIMDVTASDYLWYEHHTWNKKFILYLYTLYTLMDVTEMFLFYFSGSIVSLCLQRRWLQHCHCHENVSIFGHTNPSASWTIYALSKLKKTPGWFTIKKERKNQNQIMQKWKKKGNGAFFLFFFWPQG